MATNDKYVFSFEEFMKEHPELDPSWEPFIRPVVQSSEDQLFNFIMSYIFM
jgi:hypothetical protein